MSAKKFQHWSFKEDEHILRDYERLGSAAVAARLGRTREAVKARARRLRDAAAGKVEGSSRPPRPSAHWIPPQPRYPSIWHYAAGGQA